jgi:hypothetical protein
MFIPDKQQVPRATARHDPIIQGKSTTSRAGQKTVLAGITELLIATCEQAATCLVSAT